MKSMPIFVVHEHHARRLHFDFRLEMEGVLKSWAVPKGLSMNPADKRLAVMVDDHDIDYAGFEGTIPEGTYGAGEVFIWDRGKYELKDGDVRSGKLEIILKGRKLKGMFVLARNVGKREGLAFNQEK
jgi:bifunctional non-homologous end joining protein LigD